MQPGICMMYSAYTLNKQGDNIEPWHTPFPIWKQSVVPCLVLTVASWPDYRFLRRQVRWSGIPISSRIFHSLLWSTESKALIVNKAEIDVFLEFSCFFYDSMDVGNFTEHIGKLRARWSWPFAPVSNMFLHLSYFSFFCEERQLNPKPKNVQDHCKGYPHIV